MSNQKRIGLEGTTKAYAGCSRIIATIQRASSTELPAESGEKRRCACRTRLQTVVQRPAHRPLVSSARARHLSLSERLGAMRLCVVSDYPFERI